MKTIVKFLLLILISVPVHAKIVINTGAPTGENLSHFDAEQSLFGYFSSNTTIITGIQGYFRTDSADPATAYVTLYDPDDNIIALEAFVIPGTMATELAGPTNLNVAVAEGPGYSFRFSLFEGPSVSMPDGVARPLSYYALNNSDTHGALVENPFDFGVVITGVGDDPAVPEPQGWGIMLLGFGTMGIAMRRRAAAQSIFALSSTCR